jgi:hypothetical protein
LECDWLLDAAANRRRLLDPLDEDVKLDGGGRVLLYKIKIFIDPYVGKIERSRLFYAFIAIRETYPRRVFVRKYVTHVQPHSRKIKTRSPYYAR